MTAPDAQPEEAPWSSRCRSASTRPTPSGSPPSGGKRSATRTSPHPRATPPGRIGPARWASREVAFEDRRPKVDAAVERLIGLGATKVRTYDEPDQYWVVMQDPEGNEFCLQ